MTLNAIPLLVGTGGSDMGLGGVRDSLPLLSKLVQGAVMWGWGSG